MKIVLNHKMNLDYEDIKNYIKNMDDVKHRVIVLPSYIYIDAFVKNGFIVGCQNIYTEDFGPYTGEISPMQISSIGAEYVLIGHNERKVMFNEDYDLLNKKVKSAIKNGLKVILCVGENKGENEDALYKQVTSALNGVNEKVCIVYEPVYSIGTGIIPSNEEIEKKVHYIKSLVNCEVLYGGSVLPSNIDVLKKVNNIDGFILGSSSLNPQDVKKILEVVQ